MEASGSGTASNASTAKLKLLDLPAENLSQIVSYIPKKSIFPLLTVSKRFHHLASAALYRNLWFSLAQSDIAAYHRDPAYRLSDALHTFLTSSHDYAQHVKSFTLRMIDSDHDQIQKRVASKFMAREEAGKLLNTALVFMIKRARGLEQFIWQVPIECSHQVYQALSVVASLQVLHIHLDIASVSKHSYQSFAPPPPSAPVFGGQSTLWWDPMNPGMYPPGSVPVVTTGGKSSKTSTLRAKAQGRNFGSVKGLQNLSITAIDDLSCLEEIASCLKGSSGTLRSLTLSFAESLVSRSQKPHPSNAHNNPPIQDDDATTEPGSPNMNAVGSAPTDLDLKREKEAQEQALARIFSLDKAPSSVQKQDRKVEKSLKRTAKNARVAVAAYRSIDKLGGQILEAIQNSNFKAPEKAQMQHLLQTIFPTLNGGRGTIGSGKFVEGESSSKKNKWSNNGSHPSAKFGQPSSGAWTVDAEFNPVPSKEAQDYLTPLPDFDFDPNSSSSVPTNGSSGWTSGGPLTIPPQTSKGAFPFNDDTLFPSLVPKPHPPVPAYPGSSQSSYTFHPNSSSQTGNSVSSPLPFSDGTTSKTDSQYVSAMLQKVKQLAHQFHGTSHLTSVLDSISKQVPPSYHNNIDATLALANKSSQSHGLYSSKKSNKKPLPAPITPNESSSESSSESEDDSKGNSSNVQPVALTRTNTGQTNDQDSDFDMDHPDVIESEGEDTPENDAEQDSEEIVSGSSANKEEVTDKGKQKANGEESIATTATNANGTSHAKATKSDDTTTKSETTDAPKSLIESMREYIRMTHGLSIHELVLCFIPLRTAILGRALDLTTLRRIVFYNVGSQVAFWMLIEKVIGQGFAFNFQSIYTDDVSPTFVSCLSNLPGLKSLHLLRRSSKEFSSTSSKPPATLADIHKIALTKHFDTLQSLSITNAEDDSWDIDDKLVRILASKAKKLRELAISVDSNGFHTFLRCLPGFRNLVAFHLINIKISGSPGMMPHSEWKKLVLDVVCYYPNLKIKYVAISLATTAKVSQIGEKPKTSLAAWYKKSEDQLQQQQTSASSTATTIPAAAKGKGKAKPIEDDDSDTDADGRPNVVFSKQLRPSSLADSYAIFSNLVLKGRL